MRANLLLPLLIAIFASQKPNSMADNSILTRLDGLKLKYEETGQKLTDPERSEEHTSELQSQR